MSNEIEYSVNSGEVSKELASIQAAVNQTTKINVSACVQSLAAVTQLSNAVSVLKNNYSALNLTAAATVTTLAATNAMMMTSMAQVTAVTASIMVMNTSLLQGVILWNMLTAAVLLNTAMMAQNMTQIANSLVMMDQFTASITANTAALLSNMTQTLLNTLFTGLNAIAVYLDSLMFGKLNEQLEKANKTFEALNKSCGINSALLALSAVALLLHKAALSKENKELTANTTRRTNNNKRTAAGIGLKGFEIGAMFPFPANVAMAPALGAAFTAAAFAICKMGIAALATGGVVSKPTYAMVGEGRYPEAVIPLGDSPQFAEMKSEIARAVVQGITYAGQYDTNKPIEVVVNIDSREIARATERGKRLNSANRIANVGGVL